MHSCPPLHVSVSTPRLELRGATDDPLEQLVPVVRAGLADANPSPFDDPMSLYEPDPDVRVQKRLQGVWRCRGSVTADFWGLNLVVHRWPPLGNPGRHRHQLRFLRNSGHVLLAVRRPPWPSVGREMTDAALHLCFEGFSAAEASSEAFLDNIVSNRVSEALGYERNGTT